MVPFLSTVLDDAIDNTDVDDEPDGEDDALERCFGYVESVDYLPSYVEGGREKGHAIFLVLVRCVKCRVDEETVKKNEIWHW
jgi:hypothetical protein